MFLFSNNINIKMFDIPAYFKQLFFDKSSCVGKLTGRATQPEAERTVSTTQQESAAVRYKRGNVTNAALNKPTADTQRFCRLYAFKTAFYHKQWLLKICSVGEQRSVEYVTAARGVITVPTDFDVQTIRTLDHITCFT